MMGIARTRNAAGDRTIRLRAGQTGDQLVNVILVIVVAAAIGFIGTDVNEEINDSVDIDAPSDPANETNPLTWAQENISGGYADAMGLTDIVFIVLMFGVILSVLLAFRMRA